MESRFHLLPCEIRVVIYEFDSTYHELFRVLMNELRCVFYFLNRTVKFKPSLVNCRKVKSFSI